MLTSYSYQGQSFIVSNLFITDIQGSAQYLTKENVCKCYIYLRSCSCFTVDCFCRNIFFVSLFLQDFSVWPFLIPYLMYLLIIDSFKVFINLSAFLGCLLWLFFGNSVLTNDWLRQVIIYSVTLLFCDLNIWSFDVDEYDFLTWRHDI